MFISSSDGSSAHPRSRGEHDLDAQIGKGGIGSSPLTRGAQLEKTISPRSRGLIPAHAGSTYGIDISEHNDGAHPRSRGEHDTEGLSSGQREGSSPLTRGARTPSPGQASSARLIPAHAGSTCESGSLGLIRPAHPRSRGEHFSARSSLTRANGSSPLTRGALGQGVHAVNGLRLIPAHAGSTSSG